MIRSLIFVAAIVFPATTFGASISYEREVNQSLTAQDTRANDFPVIRDSDDSFSLDSFDHDLGVLDSVKIRVETTYSATYDFFQSVGSAFAAFNLTLNSPSAMAISSFSNTYDSGCDVLEKDCAVKFEGSDTIISELEFLGSDWPMYGIPIFRLGVAAVSNVTDEPLNEIGVISSSIDVNVKASVMYEYTPDVPTVPLPAGLPLLAMGVASLLYVRNRKSG